MFIFIVIRARNTAFLKLELKKIAQLSQEQTLDYGCAGINSTTNEIVHYTDKPTSFVSKDINAGVFLMDFNIFNIIASHFQKKLKRTLSFSGALVFVLNIYTFLI